MLVKDSMQNIGSISQGLLYHHCQYKFNLLSIKLGTAQLNSNKLINYQSIPTKKKEMTEGRKATP